MRIGNLVLLTWFLVGLGACAEGETIDRGKVSGTGGTSGSGGGATVGGSGGGGTGVCGLTTSDPVCDSCINGKCFDSCNACASNQACLDYLSCLQGCDAGDTVCEGNCDGQYPTGRPLLDAFIGENGCMIVSCEAECGTQSCGLTTGDAVCDDCMNTNCYAQCEACANESQCLDLATCLANCVDTTCEDNCVNMYPYGMDPLMNLAGSDGCLELQCPVQCG